MSDVAVELVKPLVTPSYAAPAAPKPAPPAPPLGGRVLVVDDEPINLRLAKRYLKDAGVEEVITTEDARLALELIQQHHIDIVLLDVVMPGISGLEVLRQIRASGHSSRIPVLILTASTDSKTRREALESGATDFLSKPIDPHELVPRFRTTIAAKRYEDSLKEHVEQLEQEVRRRTEEIARTRIEVVHCLARAAEFRDNDTGKHIARVGRYSGIIARQLGCSADYVEMIELTAPLHDVGKIGIPDEILLKRGKLTGEEYDFIQKHTTMGGAVFDNLPGEQAELVRRHPRIGSEIFGEAKFELLQFAKTIAMTHHEKFGGGGYPLGLSGEDIPLCGRIVAVADVFDALSSRRPYKDAFPREKCFRILEEGRGSQFDPAVLNAFFAKSDEILAAQTELADH